MMKKKLYMLLVLASLISADAMADNLNVGSSSLNINLVQSPHLDIVMPILEQLNLTDEQAKSLQNIINSSEKQFDALLSAEVKNANELATLRGSNYDEKKVAVLAQAQGEIVVQGIELRLKLRHQIYATLTPMQRQQIAAQIEALQG